MNRLSELMIKFANQPFGMTASSGHADRDANGQEEPDMERLESFGLPPTFPAHMMPAAGARLVSECIKGMSMKMVRERGFMPTWKRVRHTGSRRALALAERNAAS